MKTAAQHGAEPASAWVQRWSHLVKPAGRVLDVACGKGRHVRWFHGLGHAVTGVDISIEALSSLAPEAEGCELVASDIEQGLWPFAGRKFDAVVATNYLWRPLIRTLLDSLAPGGVLIYETFTAGNETVGKPSRSDFLLAPGELLDICSSLRVVAFEDGFYPAAGGSFPRFIQRIAAVREAQSDAGPVRYYLAGSG
ncbi:MAG: class I SAM-dependent methyltransferase [Pseudomonadota bacterium]